MNIFILAFLVVVVPSAAAALVVPAARSLLHGRVREGHNDVLVPLFLTTSTIYAVMLGFLVVVVWEAYGEAKENVALEASTLATMYRVTNGMDADELKLMRDRIREYTEIVSTEEWAIQTDTGGASPKARAQVAGIYREYSLMAPAKANSVINQEFLRNFSIVAAARNKRTLQAGESVPWVLWLALIGGAVIVISMACFLYMEVDWPHMVMVSIMTLMICMLLFITILLGRPFKGHLALGPEPFEHALAVYKSVDEGN
jgi:hypothetical protein